MMRVQLIYIRTLICVFSISLLTACGDNGSSSSSNISLIEYISPFDQENAVSVDSGISVNLNSSAITNVTNIGIQFSLNGPEGNIPGTISIGGVSGQFTPDINLRRLTTYTADVYIDVTYADGTKKNEEKRISFTTSWTTRYKTDFAYNTPIATGITSDKSGNTYFVGHVAGSFNGNQNINLNDQFTKDNFLVKQNSSGETIWSRQFGTTDSDQAVGIILDNVGNIYVAGITGNGGGNVFLTKLDNAGNEQWSQYATVTKDSEHYVRAIIIDNNNQIIISGSTYGGGSQIFIAKFTADGQELWLKYLENPTTVNGYGIGAVNYSVKTDSTNNIYVVGYLDKWVEGHRDFLLTKFNTDGVVQWNRFIPPAANTVNTAVPDATGYDIVIDKSDYIYALVTTNTNLLSPFNTVSKQTASFLLKYDASGNLLSMASIVGDPYDASYEISIDSNDNIYVLGVAKRTDLLNNSKDYYTFSKYNSNLLYQWSSLYLNQLNCWCFTFNVDENNYIYLLESWAGRNGNEVHVDQFGLDGIKN